MKQKDLTENFRYFLKCYGLKSVAEYDTMPIKQKAEIAREYLKQKNVRTYPTGEDIYLQKVIKEVMADMPTVK